MRSHLGWELKTEDNFCRGKGGEVTDRSEVDRVSVLGDLKVLHQIYRSPWKGDIKPRVRTV